MAKTQAIHSRKENQVPIPPAVYKKGRKSSVKNGLVDEAGVIPCFDQFPELREAKFGKLVDERQTIHHEIEFRKTKLEKLNAEIEAAMIVAHVGKVEAEGYHVIRCEGQGREQISAEKLLQLGVDPDIIRAATVRGNPYTFIQVRNPQKKKEGKESS